MHASPPPVPGGFGFPLGVALAVALSIGSISAGATDQPVLSLVAMVVVVDVIAVLSTARATLATAAVCWCLHTGFVLGRYGELAFTAQSRHAALVLALCALAGLLFVSTVRAARAPLHEREDDPNVPSIPVQQTRTAEDLVKKA